MQSKAKTVSAYIKEAPADRRAALTKLRELCLKHLTGYEETMSYGGSSYSRNGEVAPYGDDKVGFASQKHFIGLYILPLRCATGTSCGPM